MLLLVLLIYGETNWECCIDKAFKSRWIINLTIKLCLVGWDRIDLGMKWNLWMELEIELEKNENKDMIYEGEN